MNAQRTTALQKIILTHIAYGKRTCDALTESLNFERGVSAGFVPCPPLIQISSRRVQSSVEVLHRRGLVRIKGNKVRNTFAGDKAIGLWYTTQCKGVGRCTGDCGEASHRPIHQELS